MTVLCCYCIDCRVVAARGAPSRFTLTGRDMNFLRPGEWLNDEVINFRIDQLREATELDLVRQAPQASPFHFFSSFFYTRLMNQTERGVDRRYCYANVSRWTRGAPRHLFANRLAFVPVNVDQLPWILVVIDFELHTITLYDPLDGSSKARSISQARSIFKVFFKATLFVLFNLCLLWWLELTCVSRSLYFLFQTVFQNIRRYLVDEALAYCIGYDSLDGYNLHGKTTSTKWVCSDVCR